MRNSCSSCCLSTAISLRRRALFTSKWPLCSFNLITCAFFLLRHFVAATLFRSRRRRRRSSSSGVRDELGLAWRPEVRFDMVKLLAVARFVFVVRDVGAKIHRAVLISGLFSVCDLSVMAVGGNGGKCCCNSVEAVIAVLTSAPVSNDDGGNCGGGSGVVQDLIQRSSVSSCLTGTGG